ncbi:hypothetical protein [Methylocystis sp. ATCC 49242]|uniref:hypothetical protein n=1 Tax=Methylocystis sp. ATCC 49242 TaxID=622637 RepID=UPI0001F870FF|nr:hypothetical protein [Methylocystis sp. ATCC 49242]
MIYVVQGTHPAHPGHIIQLFKSQESADKAASQLVNIILADVALTNQIPLATPETHQAVLEMIRDFYDSDDFDVWITKMEVKP